MSSPSIWNDTGHDCKYCGDIILERDARYPSRFSNAHFRCKGCERQWAQDGSLIPSNNNRRGSAPKPSLPIFGPGWASRIPTWGWVAIGVIVFALLITRFSVLGVLFGATARVVGTILPLIILALLAVALFRYGKGRGWW